MPQVFLPISVVFAEWRYRRTVEAVLFDYDVDEQVARRAAESLRSYSLQEHVEAVVPFKFKDEPRDRRIDRIMTSLKSSVTSCLERYLNDEGVSLIKGMVRRSQITLIAQGHRHFYSEIVGGTCLKTIVNSGLRILDRTSDKGALIANIADKHVPAYFLDADQEQLLIVSQAKRNVKLGHLNFDDAPECPGAPWVNIRSIDELKAWFSQEGLFVSKDVEEPVTEENVEVDEDPLLLH